ELIRREDQMLPVDVVHLCSFKDLSQETHYNFIIAMDLLDKRNSIQLLQHFYKLLKPGGQIILFESNPWNIALQFNRTILRLFGKLDQRKLFNRSQFYELLSELGFVKIFAAFTDFVYAPFAYKGIWWGLRNLSLLLENFPVVKTLAGSIVIHARKPPVDLPLPEISLCDHPQLFQFVSVVIPCHNEEMNIEPLIERLLKFYDKYLYEIIVVDDNSKDRTKEVVQRLASQCSLIKLVVRTPPNGVGRAIIDGYKIAKGKFILSMDCDFQHILPELRDLFDAALGNYDVIIGSRFSRHSVLLNYPFNKIFFNRAFHLLARLMLRGKFRDMTNNLKLIRYEVIQNLELTQPGFAINAETGLMPLLMGYKIKEVPISWINRTPNMGVSSFKLVTVGGGYWQVLKRLWWKWVFNKSSFYPTIKFPKKHRLITAK
ncbi:MAG: glycosyltransferase, partial [Segetibacter sp.]